MGRVLASPLHTGWWGTWGFRASQVHRTRAQSSSEKGVIEKEEMREEQESRGWV